MFDVLILNGVVVDGTGTRGYRADVGVVGERIDAIGDLAHAEARRVVNAAGLTVAPGFIDTHTHSEGDLLVNPQHACGLRQGITTEFLGIDGMSYAPLSPENYRTYRHWLSGLLGWPPGGPGHEQRDRLPRQLPQEGGDQYRLPGTERHPAPRSCGLARRAPNRRPDGTLQAPAAREHRARRGG